MAELGAGGLERFGKWRVVSGEVVRGRFHSLVAVTVTPSFPTIQSFLYSLGSFVCRARERFFALSFFHSCTRTRDTVLTVASVVYHASDSEPARSGTYALPTRDLSTQKSNISHIPIETRRDREKPHRDRSMETDHPIPQLPSTHTERKSNMSPRPTTKSATAST